ncbi:right-handed parallel beta-helix repeat-containing protein [Pacificimonas flava]|uniref:Uncharacterized protein n=1 Tax=Pacificimonas flava TaxID=1234595 RepID=M2SCX9_9SPHN|nr:right-handed parallel beta-helix repeat-containing protein [Pacificimonas flava]EMD83220.1 hypothetical protein C725_1121 [Pacificimonas flava]MBB5279215.1 parallel beta-helix repeat protein [Pacificimonas flava]
MAGRRRSFEERRARLDSLTANFEPRMSRAGTAKNTSGRGTPSRRLPWRPLLGGLLLAACTTLLLGGAYIQYRFQEPATALIGHWLALEGDWQAEQRPTIAPLVHLAQAVFPDAELHGFAVKRPGPPIRVAGPQAALADAPACYGADGAPLTSDRSGGQCTPTTGGSLAVSSAAALRAAVAEARAGDIIELAPGRYDLGRSSLVPRSGGTAPAPIVLRAAAPGTASILSDTSELVRLSKPWWVFANLDFVGGCGVQGCEHALHITGEAKNVIVRNNSFSGYNAPIKANANGARGPAPDNLLIEANRLTSDAPQRTGTSVTFIDVVATDGLRVTGNIISDFGKDGSDHTSYGVFAKGGSVNPVIDRNYVRCADRHRGGTRVGISLGGGGTAPSLCSTPGCAQETRGGIVRGNVVESCSDVGIYLNKAADSLIANNTLIGTRGIDVRFPGSSAAVLNNVVDGRILARDGGTMEERGNMDSLLSAAMLDEMTAGELRRAHGGDLSFANAADARARGTALGAGFPDYCGVRIDPGAPPIGAIEQRDGPSCAVRP